MVSVFAGKVQKFSILLLILFILPLSACLSKKTQEVPEKKSMPLSAESVATYRSEVDKIKKSTLSPARPGTLSSPFSKEEAIRYARQVYVTPLIQKGYSMPETLAQAFLLPSPGPGAEFLEASVYDVLLLATLKGADFSSAEWRDILTASGFLSPAQFQEVERRMRDGL